MALVLVVDDDPDILALVAERLRRDGHEVTTAVDGTGALEGATRLVPDLIVLDVLMPGRSGLEVCDILRRNVHTAAIPVLMLTALGGEQDIEGAFRVGTDDYLTKPFSLDELSRRVTELLAAEPVAGAVDAPRGSVEHEGPSRVALDHLTSRAGVTILRVLSGGAADGTALRLAVANQDERELPHTLRVFQRDGWVTEAGGQYQLTDVGRQLARRLQEMLTLIERSLPGTILAQHRYERAR